MLPQKPRNNNVAKATLRIFPAPNNYQCAVSKRTAAAKLRCRLAYLSGLPSLTMFERCFVERLQRQDITPSRELRVLIRIWKRRAGR